MSIETGVDKLLKLVQERKRITVDEASAFLSVPKETVQEWASMLQEDASVDVLNSFSKTIIKEHVTPFDPMLAMPDPREAFIRKIDRTIEQLNTDTAGFDKFKQTFEAMKQELGSDLEEIQYDLDELKKYTNAHRGLLKDAKKQDERIEEKQAEMNAALMKQQRKYDQLMEQIHALEAKHPKITPEIDAVSAQALQQYINGMRDQQRTDEEIRQALLAVGWMERIVEKFLKETKKKE